MRHIQVLAALILVVLAPTLLAEAWPRGKGKAYVYFGAATMDSDEFRMPDGHVVPFPGRDNREERLSLYTEYGLTDDFTIILNVPYKAVRTRGTVSTFESSGLADLDLRLRWSLPFRSTWLALEGGVMIPLGYDENEFPSLGSGETDLIVNLAFGRSLSFLPEGFLSLDVGYRFRGGEINDELPYAAKIGAFPISRAGIFAFVRGWESRADFDNVDPNFGLLISDSQRMSAGLELYFRLTSRVEANVTWSRVVRGRNVGDGDEYGLGIAYRLD